MKKERVLTAKQIYHSEVKKAKKSFFYRHFFLLLAVIAFMLLIFLFAAKFIGITGWASSVDGHGGELTEINLRASLPVEVWGGLYGFALTVDGVTEQFFEDLESGNLRRADMFFDCIQQDAQGGAEVFASTSQTLDFNDVKPADVSAIDDFIGCSGSTYCANNTFTNTTSIFIGSTEVEDVPFTYTYKFDGSNDVFRVGALNISGKLAFVASVGVIQQGFSPGTTANFQMLLPTPANTTQRYYFFNDPNDQCPGGGIGSSVNASLSGYVKDSLNNAIENASVNVAGIAALTDTNGFYNLSFLVLPGTYNVFASKDGYRTGIANVTVDFSNSNIEKNFTLTQESDNQQIITVQVNGFVKDESGNAISEANVSLGNETVVTGSTGSYSLIATVIPGQNPILSVKPGYNNYYAFLELNSSVSIISHNITMELSSINLFPTGPGVDEEGDDDGEVDEVRVVAEEAGQDYWISTDNIDVQVRRNTFIEEEIAIYNFKSSPINVVFDLTDELEDFIEMDKTSLTVQPDSVGKVILTIYGTQPLGIYQGTFTISGDLAQDTPVTVQVVDRRMPIESLFVNIDLLRQVISPGSTIKYRLHLQNLLVEQGYKIILSKSLVNEEGETFVEDPDEEVEIMNSLTLLREMILPEDIPEGDYLLTVNARFFNLFLTAQEPLTIANPFYLYSFFGIPVWLILVLISALSFILFNLFLYRSYAQRKKRYHLSVNTGLLPKDGPRSIKLGKIAESNSPAFYDLDMLTTHAIIAGATGGGKSIAAQVFIEEALKKNIAIIVFDPTAQWSGMLRKCEDKKMLSFYSKFGLKPSDAQAFPGNVRQITNPRQKININKYMNPGQIQIFTMNKLDPGQIDLFVSGVISEIFHSDPKEHPGLKTLLVFDEVHRLLPKFGGKGRGFLQIERACREFRKWGLGVMLVSQVLSDFVGEIKANINTEAQMRVAEESDLNRIKERYGLEALKSLVRADVGVGMVQNAEYNRGLPYFVNFRPILHSTRRLSDEVLEKYNQYGEVIDDLEYQIEQLEAEKIDTFDLKMELKLVKDKLMTGNFTVVDIYLEGLKPRMEKQWQSLGKKPKKKEIELIDESAVEASLASAQKERDKWKGGAKKEEAPSEEKKDDKAAKIVAAITFDNGMMISSLKELKDVLPSLDDSVFAMHVNDEKNEIADWVEKQIDPALGGKMKKVKTKEDIIKLVDEYSKGEEKKKEPAESPKK